MFSFATSQTYVTVRKCYGLWQGFSDTRIDVPSAWQWRSCFHFALPFWKFVSWSRCLRKARLGDAVIFHGGDLQRAQVCEHRVCYFCLKRYVLCGYFSAVVLLVRARGYIFHWLRSRLIMSGGVGIVCWWVCDVGRVFAGLELPASIVNALGELTQAAKTEWVERAKGGSVTYYSK